jgi:formylglycine-generating enzyme required for sulfatase activity
MGLRRVVGGLLGALTVRGVGWIVVVVRGRTVSIPVARGIGVGLIAVGVALPWVVMGVGGGVERGEVEKVQWRPALVKVPAGRFSMGSPEGEAGREQNEQLHEVTLTHEFYMCQTEVTQGQWEAVMGENPSNCEYGCDDDVAVHDVSWEMAVEYLNALSKLEGLEPCYEKIGDDWVWERSCVGYRLPTEAEWEYAARAGTQTAYGFGDEVERLGEYAWYGENSGTEAHVVAQKLPNSWYLFDMHGNVWEWAWDWYESDYGSQAETDPMGPEAGGSRVLRGGAFGSYALVLRSADRSGNFPSSVSWDYGLRCVRGPHPSHPDVP